MRQTPLRAAAAAALVALAPALPRAAALVAQADPAPRAVQKRTLYEDLQMLSGVLNYIRVNHPDSVDTHELIMAAIQGMVRAADPHSYLTQAVRFSPEKEKALREGKLYPIPIEWTFVQDVPVVASITPGSAVSKIDVLPGDALIAIEGKPVISDSPFELEVQLAGPKNSTITLTFARQRSDGSTTELVREVKRQRVDEATAVPVAFMLDPQTGYTRITAFSNFKVAEDLMAAVGRLEKQGMRRLVLDLRNNGGGLVDEASAVAGAFLPKGAIVYTAEGRKADVARDTGRVERSIFSHEKRYPMIVLVNSGSASASELVAGALQDHDRALIVGHPSFGKSLVMQKFPLPDGSWIEMVFGHMKTPCGRVIQRQYRGLSYGEYRRRAGLVTDTAGRPSCKTDGGRTVYGGGGIYPDVLLPEPEPTPVWLAKANERALPFQWTPGYVSANAAAFPSLDALAANPVLPAGALADFRKYAANAGIPIPAGEDADRLLTRTLLLRIADAKWNDEGFYRMAAVLDPELREAVGAFDKAAAVLATSK